MIPKVNPTVIYLVSDTPKKIDFGSCIRVMKRLRKEIDPQIYRNYNLSMYRLATAREAPDKVLKHYGREILRDVKNITYVQYSNMLDPDNVVERMWLKLKYIAGLRYP